MHKVKPWRGLKRKKSIKESHEENKEKKKFKKSLHNNAKNASTPPQIDLSTQFRPMAMHINLLPVFQSVHWYTTHSDEEDRGSPQMSTTP